jgi:hypothetical protein
MYPKKAVLLLSTQFHGNDTTCDEKNKPEINIHYNKTKGAVDTGDIPVFVRQDDGHSEFSWI